MKSSIAVLHSLFNFLLVGDVAAYDELFLFADAPAEGIAYKRPSGGTAPGPDQSQMAVRKEFPETWLWSDYISDANGQLIVRTTTPDTITSWILSAFAVSMSDGLGISEMPAETTVFKPFFVSLNLPYSMVRGETLVLQANVFNYFDKDIEVLGTLEKSSQYEGIKVDENGVEKTTSDGMIEKVTVPAGSGASVYFPMALKKLGMIDIEVRAATEGAFDGVRRQLLVEVSFQEKHRFLLPILLVSRDIYGLHSAFPPLSANCCDCTSFVQFVPMISLGSPAARHDGAPIIDLNC
ncbi:hypothetical protein HOLleu_13412 [Holothuria leucospilota]|uniref:Alpha-2-macroglobulin domain-containing protein n=1 Tax=Holothuria leucospilota TaxID=206669 RepID=A0A9Q1HEP2_HOLLE|nr:hypothetical protein HOLleu_13412 [Holothuria leucospilota]